MDITKFSIQRPVFTIVTMILFLLLGGISLINIPLKLMPDIDPPIGAVVTSYPNAGPSEVLNKVSRPLENSLATLPGLNNISSISMEGASMTILEFSWTTSMDEVENEIINRMNQTPLPQSASAPTLLKFNPAQLPIIQLTLSSESPHLNRLVNDLQNELLKIDGIASIDITGQALDEIVIELDHDLLTQYGLDQSDVVSILQAHHVTAPGGVVQSGDLQFATRVVFELTSIEDVENVVLTVDSQTMSEVTIADVASVEVKPKSATSITRTNQNPSIMMSVQQEADANLAQVSASFRERLDELLDRNPYRELEAATLFDQGDYVRMAISTVSNALIVGGIFAVLVLFAFLRSLKTPFIIGFAIPFSVIVTFTLLYFANLSLNLMTLGGLALGIGMLVDNSIVVIENIDRRLGMTNESKRAALEGTKEVGAAITASTLTTISVFLPVVFMSGIVGDIFMEFALAVSFSLFASLAVALTVVPMMASRILKAPKGTIEETRKEGRFMKIVQSTVVWALKRRLFVLSLTLLLFVASAYGVSQIETEFIPATDEGFFQIAVELEHGTPLENTSRAVEKIEDVLNNKSDILHYVSAIGSSGTEGSILGGMNSHEATLYVTMTPLSEREISTMDFADSIREQVEQAAPEADVSIQFHAMMGSAPNTIMFNVLDNDPTRLRKAVSLIAEQFEDRVEFHEVTNDLSETATEIQIAVDDKAARQYGFLPGQIAQTLNQMTEGAFATQIATEQNNVYEVYVRYDQQLTSTLEAMQDVLLRSPTGTYVALSAIVDVVEGEGPVTIQRINQQSAVQFTLHYGNQYNLGAMAQLAKKTIDDLDLPDETTIAYTGNQELMKDALSDLKKALILALVFVYLVLAAQFESFKYPFVIMFSVPLALIGVAFSLIVTDTPLSVMAFIGLIVIAGIVVNNAIVLVDYINKKKEEGASSYDAILIGAQHRVRPILMTSITTILGLVPLALGIGEGAEIQQPMAIAVIGGLVSSTFLTIIFIPVVYSFFNKETRGGIITNKKQG